MTRHDPETYLPVFERLAIEAGRTIMSIHARGPAFELKADDSPVTEADRKAEDIITGGLLAAFPRIGCVAEEAISSGGRAAVGEARFFLVDPLDGTREFVGQHDDFTVNIALIVDGVPVAGVVHAPARGELYLGAAGAAQRLLFDADGAVASRTRIRVREPGPAPTIVASRSHRTIETDAVISRFRSSFGAVELISAGSSLKFCMIAAGEADIYPRLGRTMEWDTAAGDAVLRAAGGTVTTLDGRPLVYGKAGPGSADPFANPSFLAAGALPDAIRRQLFAAT